MHGPQGSNIPSLVPPPAVPPWSCPLPPALLLCKTLERAFRHHFSPDLQSKQLRTTTIERSTCASLAIASLRLVSNETMCTILHQFQPFAWQIFAFFTPLLFRLAASRLEFFCGCLFFRRDVPCRAHLASLTQAIIVRYSSLPCT